MPLFYCKTSDFVLRCTIPLHLRLLHQYQPCSTTNMQFKWANECAKLCETNTLKTIRLFMWNVFERIVNIPNTVAAKARSFQLFQIWQQSRYNCVMFPQLNQVNECWHFSRQDPCLPYTSTTQGCSREPLTARYKGCNHYKQCRDPIKLTSLSILSGRCV